MFTVCFKILFFAALSSNLFVVDATLVRIVASADNAFQMTIGGILMPVQHDFTVPMDVSVDIPPGERTVEVIAINEGGPAGFIAWLRVGEQTILRTGSRRWESSELTFDGAFNFERAEECEVVEPAWAVTDPLFASDSEPAIARWVWDAAGNCGDSAPKRMVFRATLTVPEM